MSQENLNDDIKNIIRTIKTINNKRIIYEQNISNFKVMGKDNEYYKTHSQALLDLIKPAKINFSDIQLTGQKIVWDMEYENGIKIHYDSVRREVFLSADTILTQDTDLDNIRKIVVYLKNNFSSDNNY